MMTYRCLVTSFIRLEFIFIANQRYLHYNLEIFKFNHLTSKWIFQNYLLIFYCSIDPSALP